MAASTDHAGIATEMEVERELKKKKLIKIIYLAMSL